MFPVQMNVSFMCFQYRDTKVLCIVYLQAKSNFQKSELRIEIIFFTCGFLHFLRIRSTKLYCLSPSPKLHVALAQANYFNYFRSFLVNWELVRQRKDA